MPWMCPECGTFKERDANPAKNILATSLHAITGLRKDGLWPSAQAPGETGLDEAGTRLESA